MPPSSSAQDLSKAITALQKSLSILIIYYKGYIKCVFLFLLVYLFYRLGNMTVNDERLEKKQELEELVERRIKVRVEIPKTLIRVRKLTFTVLIGAGLFLILEAVGYYFKVKVIKRNWGFMLSIIMSLSIIALTVIQLYKYWLQKKFRQNQSLQRTISKSLTEFQTILGPKVNKLLKYHLCKPKVSKMHTSLHSLDCVKADCKQLRSMYKNRVQAMEGLVNSVVDFEWCTICRKRKAFDEYLGFQARQYEDRGDTQIEQIKYKMAYLLQGLDRIRHWLTVTAPCNCSKLYWALSTETILQYKQKIKSTQTKIKMLQSKANY